MSKLMFVGDVHLSDKAPSTRTDEYTVQILEKLFRLVAIATEHEVDAVLFAGDIFHSKTPSRSSHTLVRRAMKIFQKLGDSVGRVPIVVPGNHDYRGANVNELVHAPLGVMAEAGVVELIGVPGKPWGYVGETIIEGIREEEPIERFSQVDADVLLCHSPIFPTGANPPYPHFKAGDVAKQIEVGNVKTGATRSVKWVLYGHIHESHGWYQVGSPYGFVNPGSLSRGSLYEENPQRSPQVAIIDTEVNAKFVTVPHKPWTEVFRVVEEGEKKGRERSAEDFAEALSQAALEAFSIEKVVADLRSRDLEKPVIERAVELVEEQ